MCRQKVNEYERTVRWLRQTAIAKGLINKGERAVWSITDAAKPKLANMRRGTILTFAIGENGFLLWANAEDAVTVPKGRVCNCCSLLLPTRYPGAVNTTMCRLNGG